MRFWTALLFALSASFFSIALGQMADTEAARKLYLDGNYIDAKKSLEAILKKDKKNHEAHYYLGRIYLRRDFFDEDEAVDHLEEAVDMSPNNADYHFAYGEAMGAKATRSGMLKKALLAPKIKGAFEKAVQIDPTHLGANIGLAQYYSQAPSIMGGDVDKAMMHADVVLSLDEYQGHRLKAQIHERNKNLDKAEQEWKSLTAKQPKEWRAWKNLGYFYLRTNRAESAAGAFDKYVAVKPDTADAYDSRSEAFVKLSKLDEAEKDLRKALELDRTFAPSVERLAQVLEQKGQKKEARETYQWYLTLEKDETKRKQVEGKLKGLK